MKFSLMISSVNVTKSAGNCGFGAVRVTGFVLKMVAI